MSLVLGQSPEILRPPFPRWKQHYVVCVEQALSYGMKQLKGKKAINELEQADERRITYWLYKELLDLVQEGSISGFTRDVFELPHIDAPTENADGTSIQNMPDLRFNLTSAQTGGYKKIEDVDEYAWYCECKIIQKGHTSRTYKNYWDKGIQRFLDGRYARAMPHAQIIAYVKWPCDPTGFGSDYKHLIKQSKADDASEGVRLTTHPRAYLLPNGQPAGHLELRHLWFKFS